MKSFLFTLYLCCAFSSYAQITFEEIESPDDFTIQVVRQSPIGEYFIQAYNDQTSVYTSMDGVDWVETPLAEARGIEDMIFFEDGTPVLQFDNYEHQIRRNGVWYMMDFVSNGWDGVESTFIKGDTLFAYENYTIGYSLDQGVSFTTLFNITAPFTNHRVHLWKLGERFIFHHTAGASDYLSLFELNGDLIWTEDLDVAFPDFLYSDCGELIIVDNDDVYYQIDDQNFTLTQGVGENLVPNINYNTIFRSVNGNYYYKDGDTIYKSSSCGIVWTPMATSDLIGRSSDFWINNEEAILTSKRFDDHFSVLENGSSTWENNLIDIDYSYIRDIDESPQGNQVALTYNALFNKTTTETEWTELAVDSLSYNSNSIQYSPNGTLYLIQNGAISYSQDDGNTFNEINPLPFLSNSYLVMVLDDGVLLALKSFGFSPLFYSVNNGQSWVETVNPLTFFDSSLEAKYVGNYIYLAELFNNNIVARINTLNNEVTTATIEGMQNWLYNNYIMQDDGTIYYFDTNPNTFDLEDLYRYQFGGTPEFLGSFPTVGSLQLHSTSTNDLMAFGGSAYYTFNGIEFIENEYIGIPSFSSFFVSQNEYLFARKGNQIFRSTEPLVYPQHVKGSVFYDVDDDCETDVADQQLKHWKIKVENDNYLKVKTTDNWGDYLISVPQGDYTVSAQPINDNWTLCESEFDLTINADNTMVEQDFQAQALVDCANLEVDFSTPFLRRCFDNYYAVRVRNTGPAASTATTLTFELDPFFDFNNASIPYTQPSGSILEFDLGSLALDEEVQFYIYFTLSCDADLGQTHCMTGSLMDAIICPNDFNSYQECQENIGSYDPNDKRIFNEDGDQVTTLDKNEYLYYHIRFQNTGTDTAFTVRIVDPISEILDINTLEMLSASHPYTFEISDGPNLVVNFANILLPDSTTNEPASHGFFKFKIKPFAVYDYGTSIRNQAGIYFDFNDPIITNEAVLVIEDPVSTNERAAPVLFGLFPNPATDRLTLDISETDWQQVHSYEIVNQLGQLVEREQLAAGKRFFDVSKLPTGVYFFVLKDATGSVGMVKFLKH